MPHAHVEAGASELAARVCHEEQMTVWSGEIMGTLSIGGYLREDWSYEDTISASAAVAADIRSIVESAFDHPELKDAALAPAAVPESVRRLLAKAAADLRLAVSLAHADYERLGDYTGWNALQSAENQIDKLLPALLATPSSVQAGEAVSAPASAGAVPGWVADEPTPEMYAAARDWSKGKYGMPIGNEAARGCWQAMLWHAPVDLCALAAAPAPASAGAVPEGWRLVPVAMPDAAFLAIMEELRSGTPLADHIWEKATRAAAADPRSIICAPHEALAAAPATPEPAAGGREAQQRADILLALEAALVLLGRNEPGDSRAVSDEFVAMASAVAGRMNDAGRQTLLSIMAGPAPRSILSASTADGETAGDGWQDIGTVPEGVEVVVRGGKSVFGDALRGSSIAVIHDRANLYRPDGTLRPSSPTMWHRAPAPPTPTRPDATAEDVTPAEGR